MKKLIIAIALLATVASAQSFWTIKTGGREVGLFPSYQACQDYLRYWQSQGGYGFCGIASN